MTGLSSDTKHFVFITFGFHPPWNEGSINIIREIIEELLTIGNKVYIISIKRLVPKSHYINNYKGAPIYYLSPPLLFSKLIRYELKLTRFVKFLLDLYYLIRVCIILRCYRITADMVFLSNVSYSLFAPLLKYIFRYKIVPILYKPSLFKFMNLDRFFDAYVCIARKTMELMYKLGIRREKLFSHLPLPLTRMEKNVNKEDARRILKLPVTSTIITYLGSLTEKRLPRDFLQAYNLQENNDTILLIIAPKTISSYSYLSRNRDLWKKNSKIIVRVQNLTEEEKSLVLYATDFIIFPYVSGEIAVVEPPYTLLEAISKGCIPIVTRSCLMDEIILNKINGVIVENPVEVMHSIKTISSDDVRVMKDYLKRFAENRFLGTPLIDVIIYVISN